jgi:hypothetical protein
VNSLCKWVKASAVPVDAVKQAAQENGQKTAKKSGLGAGNTEAA